MNTTDTESIIRRARNLLNYMGEHDVAGVLHEGGIPNETSFLCIKAAKILNTPCN